MDKNLWITFLSHPVISFCYFALLHDSSITYNFVDKFSLNFGKGFIVVKGRKN